jgi:multiple sugar transport system ATP-binding protein
VRDPQVFLLDEPLSNLDAKLRNSAREELRQFQERIGVTSIYVTHDQVEAMGLGDRICVMQGGVIRQVGTPQEIYLDPADIFVASFIGSPPMNLVKEEKRTVGFRPEIFLPESCFEAGEDLFRVQFTIQRVEYLGGDRILYGMAGNPLPPTKVVSRLPATVNMSPEIGSTVSFALRQTDLRYFDAEGVAMPVTQRAAVRKVANG